MYWLVSILLGAIAVLQAGLNRHLARDWGLSLALVLNCFVLLIAAIVLWGATAAFPQYFPTEFEPRWGNASWRWWLLIPGLCGIALVAGIPAAIPKLGATSVFMCLVVGQLAFSLIWDAKVEHIPIDARRLIGVALAAAGLFFAQKS
jgi:bacterial/archaeal transporter family-2 protein